MKHVMVLTVSVLVFGAGPVFALLEVGDPALCVTLEGVDETGSPWMACIRDTVDIVHSHTVLSMGDVQRDFSQQHVASLSYLANALDDVATIRVVNWENDSLAALEYLRSFGPLFHYSVAFDPSRFTTRTYDTLRSPTTYVVDDMYRISYVGVGVVDRAEAEVIIESIRSF